MAKINNNLYMNNWPIQHGEILQIKSIKNDYTV